MRVTTSFQSEGWHLSPSATPLWSTSLPYLQSSQINRDSGGHSWSLPRMSEPHWAQTHSSHPPSPPGWWCHQTEPGRRCLWSAQWRRVPHWWRHGLTSQHSASHTPQPVSLLLGGSPTRSNELSELMTLSPVVAVKHIWVPRQQFNNKWSYQEVQGLRRQAVGFYWIGLPFAHKVKFEWLLQLHISTSRHYYASYCDMP